MRACLLILPLLLTACGFHLAGRRPLSDDLRKVYVDTVMQYTVTEPPVETQLRAILQRRGATVINQADSKVTTIRLTKLEETREVLSIGTDGKANEFRLVTRVHYEVFRGATTLVTPGDLVATRDYSFDPQQVLAKEVEEQRLREFIQSQLAELLMLRIDAALTYHSATVVPAAPVDAEPAH
ncbi:LPS assembly lipoprotein LptE [Solimonas soli]|uniref:LPS-assembly lipoprotein LptE n=1 Tax=Solimonas soli TaxID=413479 RepID=UPI0005B9EE2C|nr:LPS assembly lipoprotein LptE [Solimonas soli]